MVPYADFLYFGLALYLVVPTLIVRLTGWGARAWILLATVLMLAVQYAGSVQVIPGLVVHETWMVAGYALFQGVVAVTFLQLRPRLTSRWPSYVAIGLGLVPLAAAKFVPLLS